MDSIQILLNGTLLERLLLTAGAWELLNRRPGNVMCHLSSSNKETCSRLLTVMIC